MRPTRGRRREHSRPVLLRPALDCFYLEGESCPDCVEEANAASEKSWNETVNADNPPGEWDVPPAEEPAPRRTCPPPFPLG